MYVASRCRIKWSSTLLLKSTFQTATTCERFLLNRTCSSSAAATSACWDSASHPQVCSFCLGSHLGSPPRPVLAQVAMVSTSQDTGTMFCSPMAPTRNTRMALVSLYLSGTSARTLLPSCLLALTVVCCSSRDIVVRHVLCDNNWRQGLSCAHPPSVLPTGSESRVLQHHLGHQHDRARLRLPQHQRNTANVWYDSMYN